jgi:hypothetical protein
MDADMVGELFGDRGFDLGDEPLRRRDQRPN